jgi:hypothetical protein
LCASSLLHQFDDSCGLCVCALSFSYLPWD